MTEFEAWGIPALERLKMEHPDYTISRAELAEIIENTIATLSKDGRKIPKWFLGNFIADLESETHRMYHESRPRENVCFYCMGTGEKPNNY
jgi:hypothetical protein